MSNTTLKSGLKFTISTDNGIFNTTNNKVSVAEVSGPVMNSISNSFTNITSTNRPQLRVGATNSKINLQLGVYENSSLHSSVIQSSYYDDGLSTYTTGFLLLNPDSGAFGNVGIGTTNPLCDLHINGTSGITIPVGSTSQRPDPLSQGTIRYNTTTTQFEGYDGNVWSGLGGVVDILQNTKITAAQSPSVQDNTLRFFTSGAIRQVIDNAGRVGIGTNSPTDKLEITDSNSQLRLTDSDDNKFAQFSMSSSMLAIRINSTSSADFFIKEGGNVGIGTTNPRASLEIMGFWDDEDIIDETNGGIHFSTKYPASSNNTTTWGVGYIGGYIKANYGSNSGYPGGLVFKTRRPTSPGVASHDLTTSMVIDSYGWVGIGTTNPTSQLHVHNSATDGWSGIKITAKDREEGIQLWSQGKDDNNIGYILFNEDEGGKYGFSLGYNGSSDNAIYNWRNNSFNIQRLDNNSTGVTVLTIPRSTGYIGIGTSNPSSTLYIKNTNTSYNASVIIDGPSHSYLQFFKTGTSIGTVGKANTGTNNMYFYTTSTSDDVFIQHNGGNVGIGTLTPYNTLEVNGSITVNGYASSTGLGGIYFRSGTYYRPSGSSPYNCSIFAYAHNSYPDGISINGYDGISFCTGSNTRNQRMIINSSGNVSIGTSNRSAFFGSRPLSIGRTDAGSSTIYDMLCLHTYRGDFGSTPGGSAIIFENRDSNNSNNYGRIKCMTVNDTDYGDNDEAASNFIFQLTNGGSAGDRMIITGRGAVGIGTMYPTTSTLHLYRSSYGFPLRIQSGSYYADMGSNNSSWFHMQTNAGSGFFLYKIVGTYQYFRAYTTGVAFFMDGTGSTSLRIEDSNKINTYNTHLYLQWNTYNEVHIRKDCYVEGTLHHRGIVSRSDSRIKINITDASGSEALEKIRKIKATRYDYVDIINYDKTWGWIAQQVKEICPDFVELTKGYIPNIMKYVEFDKEIIKDPSGNQDDKYLYKIKNFRGNNDIDYKFYESYTFNTTNQDFFSTCNNHNEFILNENLNTLFMFGYKVDDFHRLKKDKLQALVFSAVKEIDDLQQTHLKEMDEIKTQNQQILQENIDLKQRIERLEKYLSLS